MSHILQILPLLFFAVAFIYSTVGFAGGSSYLLVLTLAGFTHTQSAPIALICNLVVSSVGFFHFYKAGHFRFRLVLPFMALSIPLAFVGAHVPLKKEVFYILLGACLAFAGLRLFLLRSGSADKREITTKRLWSLGLPAGALMGFFSGLVGIGGGIFLSPFLILTGLATLGEASAAASFFIFVNSLSGLAGKLQNGLALTPNLWLLAFSAFLGGWIGSRLGSHHLPLIKLQRILAGLVLFISINLVLKAF